MNILKTKSGKHRWLVSLVITAIVVAISAVIICSNQVFPADRIGRNTLAVSDGSGGVIIIWQDDSSLLAQHIDSSGRFTWDDSLLITDRSSLYMFSAIPDNSGGVIVYWEDEPENIETGSVVYSGSNEPVPFYCRRITSDGYLAWSEEPVSKGKRVEMIGDGNGGVILAWDANEPVTSRYYDNNLRIQKMSSNGKRLWSDNGILVVSSPPFRLLTDEEKAAGIKGTSTQSRPTYLGYHRIVADDFGGVFVIWNEEDTDGEVQIYVQRLDSSGKYIWPEKISAGKGFIQSAESDDEGGVLIRTSGEDDLEIHVNAEGELLEIKRLDLSKPVIDDGTGGSFIIRVEEDPPYGDPQERLRIYWIKRLDSSGQPVWEEQRTLPDDSRKYECIDYTPDGSGGVIVTRVLEKASGIYTDAKARKLDSDGTIAWNEQDIPVFDVPDIVYQRIDSVFSDNSGGIIVIGILGESAIRGDMIYAQRLDAEGNHVWGSGIRIDH